MQRQNKIRPPKRSLRHETDEFDQQWDVLREALTDIHNRNSSRLLFEHLYRASYKIVLKKQGERLYTLVQEFESKWFADQVIPQLQAMIAPNLINVAVEAGTSAHERREMGDTFMKGLKEAWENHRMSMNMVADILMYLDKGFLKETRGTSIFVTTIGLFRDHLVNSNTVIGHDRTLSLFDILSTVILDHIDMEREGDVINRSLIHSCVKMLEDLYETDEEMDADRLYLIRFEPHLLEASRTFYRSEAFKLLRNGDASIWIRQTHRRLLEEEDRCKTTLSTLSIENMTRAVEAELISAHLSDFLALENNGLKQMLDDDRVEDLAILYQLVARVDPSKDLLKKGVLNRILALGAEIEKNLNTIDFSVAQGDAAESAAAEKPKAQALSQQAQQTAAAIKWVHDVLDLRAKFDVIWEKSFAQDPGLQTTMTKAFSDFIHQFSRSSEFVSLYIDENLKRGIRGKSDLEVTAILDRSIVMIRYLKDKDLFERYYQKHLGRRLLHSRASSEEAEKQLITMMQLELGKHFTSKFEGMFKDITISEELSTKYGEHIRSLGDVDAHHKPIDLSISVLTSNSWPPDVMGRPAQVGRGEGTPSKDCNYPPEIRRLQDSFFKFYLKDRSGRVLTWVGSAGSADVKCVFPPVKGMSGQLGRERRYELNVSTYGMIALMLFNSLGDGESLSFEDIQAETSIPPKDLSRALASLSINPKARVLLKEPATKTIRPGDKFSFNASFVSKAIKIKAPVINSQSKVEGDEERQRTEDKNDETRRHMIDAAIVRIMKSRKELAHNALLAEVIGQLVSRFQPDVAMIKTRIEDLIAREYLERLDDSAYKYMA